LSNVRDQTSPQDQEAEVETESWPRERLQRGLYRALGESRG